MYVTLKQYSSFIIGAALVVFISIYTMTCMKSTAQSNEKSLKLSSTDFKEGQALSVKQVYTRCGGENKSPALSWIGAPIGTKSFVVTIEDPDAPHGTFIHWVLFNIPGNISSLPSNIEKAALLGGNLAGARQGINHFNEIGYDGPCPPSGTHRYVFTLYALDTMLDADKLNNPVDFKAVTGAFKSHLLAEAKLTGTHSARK